MATEEKEKLSPVETIKTDSNYLRGEIGQELVDGNDLFGKDSINLLKHHGTYQQDDRDDRAAGRGAGGKSAKSFMFMVRTKIPGGKLTSDQLLAELDLCDEVGNTTLRITSRQGLQLHGVLKGNLQADDSPHQRRSAFDAGRLRRRRAQCHVLPGAASSGSGAPADAGPGRPAGRASCPRTRAYHEIWLTDPDTGEQRAVRRRARRGTRSSRSTARPICRASSRPPSACPATIASTCMPTTWA